MKRILGVVLAVCCLAALAVGSSPASAQSDSRFYVDEESLPFEAVSGFEDSERRWGVLDGAGYRIEVPADWNGELVMWAHGFRGEGDRLYFNPEEVPFREWLLENGYAWAASTYTANGYVAGIGARDTNELAKFFRRSQAKDPDRIYISGASMGGHITARSIERYRSFYDGAMPVCGVTADYELFDYFLDFNVAAQQLALGESNFPVDPAVYAGETVGEIKAALESAPGSWPYALNEKGEQLKQLTELRSGGDRPNFDEAWAFWNSSNFLFDLGLGDGSIGAGTKVAVSNRGTRYQTDLDPAISASERELNASVVRVGPQPGARALVPNTPSPQIWGRMTVPTLTMHNLGDLFVPFHNTVIYGERTARRGNQDLLVQRAIRGVSHCGFTTAEYEAGFSDLVNWVENGERPEGDDLSSPEAIADPNLGCKFTDFETPDGHAFATPCPES